VIVIGEDNIFDLSLLKEAQERILELELDLQEQQIANNAWCTADCCNNCMNYAGAMTDVYRLEEEVKHLKVQLKKEKKK
jgi:hypothetical protein